MNTTLKTQKRERPNHTTWRAIVLGLLLTIPHGYFSVQTPTPSTVSLIYPVILNLTLLILLNLVLKRWLPRQALSQGELLTIYTMLSLAVAIGGHDVMHVTAPILGHAFWFATPENEWQTLFFSYLPRWLVVDDLRVLKGLYEGDSSFYNLDYVKTWLTPVFWWSMLLFALMVVMLGINTIIRKQWMEHERLAYPIIQLPLAMTRDGGSGKFLGSRTLWIGIAIGGGINLINGLHAFFPAVPLLPIRNIEIGHYFTEKPLSAIGWTPVCFFPFVIGLSYFMPLDLSFSCWFFYLIWKLELVLGAILGLRSLPEFPYIKPQTSGAYVGIAAIALFSARKHLYSVFRSVFDKSSRDDAEEPMRYRTALGCILLGGVFLAFFCTKAGMSLWVFFLFFGFYFMLVFALSRLRAELGPPVNELYNIGPDQMLPRVFGTRQLGASNLTMFALFWGFNRAHRCNPMPYQLEAFKLAEEAKTNQKYLVQTMALTSLLGIWVAFWSFLDVRYREGFGGSFGWEAYLNLERWLYYMPGRDIAATAFMGGGFGLMLILTFLRRRLLWWTLHPVAYPMGSSWTMNWMWFPIFISWLIKRLLLKHGGIAAYRNAIPFFFGLILGEFFIGGIWNIYGVLSHQYIYTFWH
ncbi:hypothetical protein FJZ31_01835 [Candidatus Poribacteria bacterium]|nr:hypothetical protein [Candidatus Poribacteria bacterium]